MEDLGRTIAMLREQVGLSQKELAGELCRNGICVTNQAISKWENGSTQPSAQQFLRLCQILGVRDVMGTFAGSDAPYGEMSGLNEVGKQKVREYIDLLLRSGLYSTETTLS